MAKLNLEKLRKHIQKFEFKALFDGYGLGWDNPNVKKPISVNGTTLTAIAEKRGFLVFVCEATVLPNALERKKIAQHIDLLHHEHLIIYFNAEKQIWQIAVKELNKPIQYKEVEHYSHQEPDLLLSKLQGILFTIAEEDAGITLIDVTDRIDNSFNTNTEKTTKKFYDHFRKQHAAFMALIQGLENPEHQRWYASLMMNRLMFIYFIQKKGFLDDDVNYLRTKLNHIQQVQGEDKFYSFYRNFLLAFFHNGLGKEHKNDKELIALIGNVPYLNGGLFDVHELEKDNADIQITDSAFTQLFDFFDQYQWHLDNGINAKGNEINPDVIGYIFEKYINDRAAMGAYYTKEDITEYISKNTIIPFLFDKAKIECANAFKSDGLWRLLKQTPDRYIYDAVKKGCDVLDIPENIEIGIDATLPNLLDRRKDWNSPTPENFGLPTEIWRETIARRQRYLELKTKLENGEITELNDFITYNLNIRQFAQDALEFYEGSDFIEAFYNAIEKITILDPTCGSGAFLFAALNILEPLYEACIKRMREFIDPEKPNSFKNFQDIISDIDKHQNPTYWIYKSIILNNLYGVDIMPEAVEIAKLRLFLKLAATAKASPKLPNLGLEPLPDIDFNIRCGNTLVGYTTHQQIKTAIECDINGQVKMVVDDSMVLIDGMIEELQGVLRGYKANQLLNNSVGLHADKQNIKDRLAEIKESLDFFLARDYGIDNEKLAAWKSSHQPFHWFTEFFHIINNGGFDVIIGNPPYVNYSKIKPIYKLSEVKYSTLPSNNLYAFVVEMCMDLINQNGFFGFIIPLSSTNANGNTTFQKLIRKNNFLCISHYAMRPAKLFAGAEMDLTMFVGSNAIGNNKHFTTKFNRWNSEFRPYLFENISYINNNNVIKLSAFPKFQTLFEMDIWKKIMVNKHNLSTITGSSKNDVLFFHGFGRYWRKCIEDELSDNYQKIIVPIEFKSFAFCVLNSQLIYWSWVIQGDCYRFTKTDALSISVHDFSKNEVYCNLHKLLLDSYAENSQIKSKTARNGIITDEMQFNPKKSKPIIDEIDKVLAAHYGFTDEELDFIINYDIKYRMGKELD